MSESIPLVQVGQTDLKVTTIGLGTAHIAKGSTEQAVAIIHKALELGITLLDTAPLYRTEPYLGLALQGVPRESFVLATKVGRLPDGQGGFTFNYSRDDILKSIDNSLTALKLDHVDILHIHDPDDHYEEALNEAFPTLAELRHQGVIKAVGAGMNQSKMLADFATSANFDCFLLAGRYTLLEQTSLDDIATIHDRRMSIFAGGVYNSGILATGATANATYNYRAAPAPIVEKAKRLEAICTRHNVPLNAAAVQFTAANPGITSLVIGADQVEQVEANVNAMRVEIPVAFWQELRAENLIEPNAPLPEAQ
ncbi:MAG: aldo/keto reductase [Anaerolineaceae bacterium]|nr:aldo/keto reductase [Anaerolineaceae bacterium]